MYRNLHTYFLYAIDETRLFVIRDSSTMNNVTDIPEEKRLYGFPDRREWQSAQSPL
jgi:hypothetical protein